MSHKPFFVRFFIVSQVILKNQSIFQHAIKLISWNRTFHLNLQLNVNIYKKIYFSNILCSSIFIHLLEYICDPLPGYFCGHLTYSIFVSVTLVYICECYPGLYLCAFTLVYLCAFSLVYLCAFTWVYV